MGSITVLDSTITNTAVAFNTSSNHTGPNTFESFILENIQLTNVAIAIEGAGGSTVLAGSKGTTTIAAFGAGHSYTGTSGPTPFEGAFAPPARPASLLSGSRYYSRSKPQYEDRPVPLFVSARSIGAKGDGVTDDTASLQAGIDGAARRNKIFFFDAGTYKVTKTLYIPPKSRMVGESYSVIMSSGSFFNDQSNPQPVVQIGYPGQSGVVEWSDMIVSTQGMQEGAILIQWNLISSSDSPSGMWDVHTRVGGFDGSNLQLAQCPTTPTVSTVDTHCIAAYTNMHITKGATGLYMENNWLWTADHDVDNPNLTQITIYSARGLLIESVLGTFWLVGTAVEHNTFYQYQLSGTQNIFMGQIQTETPYYQPNPAVPVPFTPNAALNDPTANNGADAYGLRVLNSRNILVYGAGLYSFFDNYSTVCSETKNENCQPDLMALDGSNSAVTVYNLNGIGAPYLIEINGVRTAAYFDNVNNFPANVALFRSS